ncbi:MAG TPA: hypothetical protein VFE32_00795 [Puia sp.]|jgi:hypothetical protein|nr:hypothetical protein [Puia sp.]
MLTQREKDFIRYWEANRLRRKKVVRQFLIGIPVGLLFVIPIAINFASGWYRRADMEAHSPDFNPMVLFVALLLIVGFTAIFYQRHKWDQYEQHYQELKARLSKEGSAADPAATANQTPVTSSSPAEATNQTPTPPSNPAPAAHPPSPTPPTDTPSPQ